MPMVRVNSLFVPQFAREAMIPSPATSPPGFLELSAAPSCGPGRTPGPGERRDQATTDRCLGQNELEFARPLRARRLG